MSVDLNPTFLITFKRAYELKNFTQTAKIMGMTQSGVSQHIAQLEKTLECKLFERIKKSVIPTQNGDRLYRFSSDLLERMDEFVKEEKSGKSILGGNVRLGVPGSFGVFFLPILVNWQKKNPLIQFQMEYGPNETLLGQLLSGKLDLAVVSELAPKDFESIAFFDEEFVLVRSKDFKLGRVSTMQSLLKFPFVDYPGSDLVFGRWFQGNFPKDCSRINELFIKASVNNMESVINLVCDGIGLTILPKSPLLPYLKRKDVQKISAKKRVYNTLFLVQRKKQILSRQAEELKGLVLRSSTL